MTEVLTPQGDIRHVSDEYVADEAGNLTATTIPGAIDELAAANTSHASTIASHTSTIASHTSTIASQASAISTIQGAKISLRTVTVDEEALTGTSITVPIGAALPTGAVVLAHEIVVNEQGVLAGNDLTIVIGGTDDDAIVASTDLDGLAIGSYSGTAGVHPRGLFSGETLNAIFAASDLATLSAGNWTINVWYLVPA
jgi:hypothetical protein